MDWVTAACRKNGDRPDERELYLHVPDANRTLKSTDNFGNSVAPDVHNLPHISNSISNLSGHLILRVSNC